MKYKRILFVLKICPFSSEWRNSGVCCCGKSRGLVKFQQTAREGWTLLSPLRKHKLFCFTHIHGFRKKNWTGQANDTSKEEKGNALPIQSWPYLYCYRSSRHPEFLESRHMNVIRLSAIRTDCLYPQKIHLVVIYVSGWVDCRAIVRPEGCHWKIQITPLGIETATLRLVAQYLNQLRHHE